MEIQSYTYSCVMAMAPERLAQKVRRFSLSIPDDYIFQDKSGDYGREDKPHVTVKYGLITELDSRVRKRVNSIPFMISLGNISVFDNNDNFTVLKVDIISDGLRELNREISKLPNEDKFAVYKPHMTIAYLRKNLANPNWYKRYLTDEFKGESWLCDSLMMTTPSKKRYEISLLDSLSESVKTDFYIKLSEKGL